MFKPEDKPFEIPAFDIMLDMAALPTSEEVYERCKASPTAFDNWFPIVEQLNIRTPKTKSLAMGPELQKDIMNGVELSEAAELNLQHICKQIQTMGQEIGFPLFIKTAFTSAKHYWHDSCVLPGADRDVVLHHLVELLMYQSMSPNPFAPSLVVREMIDTAPVFTAFTGQMPVTQEFRVFADSGKIHGYQPYWPKDAIQDPSCEDWEAALESIKAPSAAQLEEMVATACNVTSSLGGYWSVDFLADKEGNLWLIDMAEGQLSYVNEADYVNLKAKEAEKYTDNEPSR
jgi:hypothetical protein